MVVAVATLAVLVTVGVVYVVQANEAARVTKLEADIQTVNTALRVYELADGDLSTATTPATVLGKLKTEASATSERQLATVTGSLIDHRLDVEMQSAAEGATDAPRAYWNDTAKRFDIAISGPAGIKRFILNRTGSDTTTEDRTPSMKLATEDGWIWDHDDPTLDVIPGPTVVPLGTASAPSPVAATSTATAPPVAAGAFAPPVASRVPAETAIDESSSVEEDPAPSPLATPVFSFSDNIFRIDQFPSTVALSNPNPASVSLLTYSIDNNTWQTYTGPITLEPNMRIDTRAVSLDPSAWTDSASTGKTYLATEVRLDPPVISPSRTTFGTLSPTSTIDIVNPNDSAVSQIEYRTNGGGWQSFTGPFVVDVRDYLTDVTIEARAVPIEDYYLTSTTVSSLLTNESIYRLFSGDASGSFHSPTGLALMETNLATGAESSRFEWGTIVDAYGNPYTDLTKASLEFTGTAFSQPSGNASRFEIGTLSYTNGKILADTGADTVDLRIDLDFNLGGLRSFDFDISLINTTNALNPGPDHDHWLDADIVRVDSLYSDTLLQAFGRTYRFRLDFGTPSPAGFVLFDEFHVLEYNSAAVSLYGAFEIVP